MHEFEPLRIGDEGARDANRLQQDLMRGQLVVKTETLCSKADGVNSSRHFDEFIRRCLCRASLPRAIISRRNRIFCKGVQDVGEQKLLMLLLVVQSDFEDPAYVGKLGAARLCEQMLDRYLDMTVEARCVRS